MSCGSTSLPIQSHFAAGCYISNPTFALVRSLVFLLIRSNIFHVHSPLALPLASRHASTTKDLVDDRRQVSAD